MGYRGKLEQQERARQLRAAGNTLLDIATALAVSKSSVSVWVRDVPFTPSPRRQGAKRRTHPASTAKQRQIAELDAEGITADRQLSATMRSSPPASRSTPGEGSKGDGKVHLREHRRADGRLLLRVAPDASSRSTSHACERASTSMKGSISTPPRRSGRAWPRCRAPSSATPYRAIADPTIRHAKHEHGCVVRLLLAARRRIAGSWASCGRCYPRRPFRGSSIGRALGC